MQPPNQITTQFLETFHSQKNFKLFQLKPIDKKIFQLAQQQKQRQLSILELRRQKLSRKHKKSIITRTSEYTRVIVISELNFTLLNQDCRLFSATFLPDFCNFNGIKCFLCIDLLGCALKLSLFLEFILLQTIFPYFHGIENAKLEFRPEYLDFV